jgi:hypothetical protein
MAMFQYTARPPRPLSRDWLDLVYATREPPNGTAAWLGAYHGEYQNAGTTVAMDGRLQVWAPGQRSTSPPIEARDIKLVMWTIFLGRLSIRVASMCQLWEPSHRVIEFAVSSELSLQALRIWPLSVPAQTITWPPLSRLEDSDIGRWTTGVSVVSHGPMLTTF